MKIPLPIATLQSLHNAVLAIIKALKIIPLFEIQTVDINATASEEKTIELTGKSFTKLYGAIQLSSTFEETPSVFYKTYNSVDVVYDFGSGTDGKHSVTYLLVGV